MAEREKWFTVPTEKNEDTVVSEQRLDLSHGLTWASFMSGLRKTANVVLTLLLFFCAGVVGWYASDFFRAPAFSEIKAKLEADGRAEDGQRLAELGKVCANGSGTPMACQSLYFARPHEIAQVSAP